ncbi:O-antigen polymerase [Rudaeicoccus suwonensis]|nr:O-antigen polymerase [Rudaeicoccus suwonensis]
MQLDSHLAAVTRPDDDATAGRKRRGAFITVLYGALIVVVTSHFIAGPFRYLGYDARNWSLVDVLQCGVMLLILGSMNYPQWRYPSHVAYTFLVATVAVPIIVIPVFWGPLTASGVLTLQVTTLAAFATMRLCLAGGRVPLPGLKLPPEVFWLVLLVVSVGGIVYLIRSTGISPTVLSLSDVYSQRDDFSSNVTALGSYLVGWLGSGTLPAVLAVGLYRRNLILVGSASMGILVLYSITGNKSYVVGVLLALVGYVLCRPSVRSGRSWLIALGSAVAVAAVFDFFSGSFAMTTLIVRRALATAGLNTALYFDFFSHNPNYELKHSVLSFTGAPPYDLSPASLIGLHYYGSANVSANANLVADGYANFGILGCILMAAIFGVFLRIFDKASLHLPLQVSAPSLTLVLVAAANTATLTVLSTHGGIVALVLMLFMPAVVKGKRWSTESVVVKAPAAHAAET